MKPVEQTKLTYPDGNCFAACVATLLELPLEAVPDFKGDGWYDAWLEWLKLRNLTFINSHPERHMGVGEWKEWTSFVVLDPSKSTGLLAESDNEESSDRETATTAHSTNDVAASAAAEA